MCATATACGPHCMSRCAYRVTKCHPRIYRTGIDPNPTYALFLRAVFARVLYAARGRIARPPRPPARNRVVPRLVH
jgi:hypothetical protein